MIYDVIITKDTVVIICCHYVERQLCLWQRYIVMYVLNRALLKYDISCVTGPPTMTIHRPTAEAPLFQTVDL